MTRINVIPVEQLSNGFLSCEHYEIIRVYHCVEAAILRGETPDDWRNPPTYRMGAGHVRFFYPRLGYIRRREVEIQVEMLFRGIPLIREQYDTSAIPSLWFQDWEPDEEARIANRKRLAERDLALEKKVMRGGYYYED